VGDTLNLFSDEYLGRILVNKGVISQEQLAETLKVSAEQARDGSLKLVGLGELLVQRGLIASEEVLQTCVLPASRGGSVQDTLSVPMAGQTPQPMEVTTAARDPKKVFGKYVLLKELGRGGFAVVYKAWDTMLRQFVALKLLKTQEQSGGMEEGATKEEVQEFYREAHICVKMRHENFVHVYEVGTIDSRLFISMDFIDGSTLYDFIHGGKDRRGDTYFPSDPEKFIRMMRDVAKAVHYAHSHNPPLVHRDLKPHNILVDRAHKVFVADLGMVKEVREGEGGTMSGVVKGTPEYLAPEQAEGNSKEIDARTDVWQMGIIIYEIITGVTPFYRQGRSMPELLRAICHDEPVRPNQRIAMALEEKSQGSHRPKPVPKQLETICLKAIEKKKIHRYETAQQLADDLERYLNSQEIIAQEPSVRRRILRRIKSRPLLWGTVAALLLAGGVAWAALRLAPKADPTLAIVERAEGHLAKKSWPGLRGAVGDLKALAPDHSKLSHFQSEIDLHDLQHKRLEAEWEQLLGRLKSDLGVLKEMEGPFNECDELKERFRGGCNAALVEVQSTLRNRARDIVGDGIPRDRWVDEKVKGEARALMGSLAGLSVLKDHTVFPFKASAELAGDRAALQKVIAYLGKWRLRANVLPFAEIVVFQGERELAREVTPTSFRDLEVPAERCRVELFWPSQKDPKVKMVRDLPVLRHGALVVVSGDMKVGDIQVSQ
jgi:serine/threonine protein kinase